MCQLVVKKCALKNVDLAFGAFHRDNVPPDQGYKSTKSANFLIGQIVRYFD